MGEENQATLADQAMQWLQRRERQRQEVAEGRRLPPKAQEEPAEDEWELEEDIMEEEDLPPRGKPTQISRTNGGVMTPVAKTRAPEPANGMLRVSAPKGYAAAVNMLHAMPQRKRLAPPVPQLPRSVPTSVRSDQLSSKAPSAVRAGIRAPPLRAAPPPVRAAPPPAAAASGAQFPRDKPVVIQYPDGVDRPELLDGLSDSALAYSYDGKKKSLLNETDQVLTDLLGGDAEELLGCSEGANMDNDSWDKFPDVGISINEVSKTKENFCIVTSPQHGLWGVGVNEKGSMRYYAARVALAIGLVAQAVEEGEEVDLSGVPSFEAACQLHTGNLAKKRARA